MMAVTPSALTLSPPQLLPPPPSAELERCQTSPARPSPPATVGVVPRQLPANHKVAIPLTPSDPFYYPLSSYLLLPLFSWKDSKLLLFVPLCLPLLALCQDNSQPIIKQLFSLLPLLIKTILPPSPLPSSYLLLPLLSWKDAKPFLFVPLRLLLLALCQNNYSQPIIKRLFSLPPLMVVVPPSSYLLPPLVSWKDAKPLLFVPLRLPLLAFARATPGSEIFRGSADFRGILVIPENSGNLARNLQGCIGGGGLS